MNELVDVTPMGTAHREYVLRPTEPGDNYTTSTAQMIDRYRWGVEIVEDLLTLIYAYQGSMAQLGIQWSGQSPSVERAEAWLEGVRRTFSAPPSAQ